MASVSSKFIRWSKWSIAFSIAGILLAYALLHLDENRNDAEEYLKVNAHLIDNVGNIQNINLIKLRTAKNFDSGELYKRYTFYVSGDNGTAKVQVYLEYDKESGATKMVEIRGIDSVD